MIALYRPAKSGAFGDNQQLCFKFGRNKKNVWYVGKKTNQYESYILWPWQFHTIEAVRLLLSAVLKRPLSHSQSTHRAAASSEESK